MKNGTILSQSTVGVDLGHPAPEPIIIKQIRREGAYL